MTTQEQNIQQIMMTKREGITYTHEQDPDNLDDYANFTADLSYIGLHKLIYYWFPPTWVINMFIRYYMTSNIIFSEEMGIAISSFALSSDCQWEFPEFKIYAIPINYKQEPNLPCIKLTIIKQHNV